MGNYHFKAWDIHAVSTNNFTENTWTVIEVTPDREQQADPSGRYKTEDKRRYFVGSYSVYVNLSLNTYTRKK